MAAKGSGVLKPVNPSTECEWWVEGRFGLFIHWGVYAAAARHEWIKNKERITDREYQKYFRHFNPDLYDPKAWARTAKDAGMKYFVITTKHHDGFCLWDSKQTDYKAVNTPCGRDLLKPMVKAFRDEGLKVGFYHSLIDWHHPEFPVDRLHPMRDNEQQRRKNRSRDVRKYAEYLHAQVRELLTGYGKVDMLFFDFSYPGPDGKGRDDWQSEKLLAMCRKLQPHVLVNDRLDLLDVPGGWDFRTPEQVVARDWVRMGGRKVLWETCQTFSGSWGYHRDEATWKNVEQLVVLLIDTVSKGGNLLLNVGPTGRGEFDPRAVDKLSGMGRWMKHHARSIYGCTAAPEKIEPPRDCRLTYNPKTKRLYVHVLAWPLGALHLDGLAGKLKYAQLLNDASEIAHFLPESHEAWVMKDQKTLNAVTLRLPVRRPDVTVPVIELFLK